MLLSCPNCATPDQQAGTFCGNCGYLIPADTASTASRPVGVAGAPDLHVQFAVVRDGVADPNEGFTINKVGDFLVGRGDEEFGTAVDIDVRQWVQPIDINGTKQYLIHRRQCHISLLPDGTVTVKPSPAAETDTLVRPRQGPFMALADLATLRPLRADGSFALLAADQIYMGDPNAVIYFVSGDFRSQDSYLVLELIE